MTPGNKPLPELMLAHSMLPYCVFRPQWVNDQKREGEPNELMSAMHVVAMLEDASIDSGSSSSGGQPSSVGHSLGKPAVFLLRRLGVGVPMRRTDEKGRACEERLIVTTACSTSPGEDKRLNW